LSLKYESELQKTKVSKMEFDTGSGYDDGYDDDDEPDPSDFEHDTSYHGEGFDNPPAEEIHPEPPLRSMSQLEEEDNDRYVFAMKAFMFFARNRHIRLLKRSGTSPGLEKCLDAIVDDRDAGYFQIHKKMINGKDTCVLLEFNVYDGKYFMGVDNYQHDDYDLDKLGLN
jgi:hypothetical protein